MYSIFLRFSRIANIRRKIIASRKNLSVSRMINENKYPSCYAIALYVVNLLKTFLRLWNRVSGYFFNIMMKTPLSWKN